MLLLLGQWKQYPAHQSSHTVQIQHLSPEVIYNFQDRQLPNQLLCDQIWFVNPFDIEPDVNHIHISKGINRY